MGVARHPDDPPERGPSSGPAQRDPARAAQPSEPPGGAPVERPPASPGRRRLLYYVLAGVLAAGAAAGGYALLRFPPDTTPEGAYLRIAYAISRGDARVCFAYLEDRAQHSAHSIRSFRQRASERIEASYPEPERARLLADYRAHAEAADGADVWVDLAQRRGWILRLRRDLSGIAKVDRAGDRATIETARGTRYPFRRRDNGIWGLTLFTADLVAESEKAARDLEVVDRAGQDYDRARSEQHAPKK